MDSAALVVYGLPASVVIVAIVELAKRSGLSSRWAPAVALVCGLLLATLLKLDSPTVGTWLQTELAGLMAGLTASGLYSGTRATLRD